MLAILTPRKVVGNVAVDIIPQDETYYPTATGDTADLSAVEDATWSNLANVATASYETETETDPENSFDANTLSRVKEDNVSIIGNRWTFSLERYTVLYDALVHGVRDPFSSATQTALEAGTPVQAYASNKATLPVGMRVRVYDNGGNLLKTHYMYGNLRCDGSQEYSGKLIRPQVVFEVTASTHNSITLGAALTTGS